MLTPPPAHLGPNAPNITSRTSDGFLGETLKLCSDFAQLADCHVDIGGSAEETVPGGNTNFYDVSVIP